MVEGGGGCGADDRLKCCSCHCQYLLLNSEYIARIVMRRNVVEDH